MQADERTRTVIHREWALPAPAHHTEILKALTVAGQKRDAEPGNPSDIVFTHGDDEIVLGYEFEPRTRAEMSGVLAEGLRAERDNLHERLSLAYQALARDPHFSGAHLGEDLAARVTEVLIQLRGELTEAQRRARVTRETVERVRQLAVTWSASGSEDLRVASGDLHEALDGPDDEPATEVSP